MFEVLHKVLNSPDCKMNAQSLSICLSQNLTRRGQDNPAFVDMAPLISRMAADKDYVFYVRDLKPDYATYATCSILAQGKPRLEAKSKQDLVGPDTRKPAPQVILALSHF